MAGYDHVFQRVLIRQAKAQSDGTVPGQIAWLTAMQNAQFSAVGNGQASLLSSTINGKSISFSVPAGMTQTDAMLSIESAIEALEVGLTGPPNITYGRADYP